MNEFTKEELQELLFGYQMHSHNTRRNLPDLNLCKKIQSLIDNYCEHELTINCKSNNCECIVVECFNCDKKFKRWKE
jgi:hypothetical protein